MNPMTDLDETKRSDLAPLPLRWGAKRKAMARFSTVFYVYQYRYIVMA